MALLNSRPGFCLRLGFAWVALGFAVSACVAKPAFHCQSDDACLATDGSRGVCEASGECTFHAPLGNQAGTDGTGGSNGTGGAGGVGAVSASTAGSANSEGGSKPSGGGQGGSATGSETAGAAGESCTDESARSCYTCTPHNSAQFLNACSSSACVPFDDHARLTKLTASGELPPLPPVSGQ